MTSQRFQCCPECMDNSMEEGHYMCTLCAMTTDEREAYLALNREPMTMNKPHPIHQQSSGWFVILMGVALVASLVGIPLINFILS